MRDISLEDPRKYFGFSDLNGLKDFVVYVYSCAPDLFPEEDWLKPENQMTLERAFIGLRYGLALVAEKNVEPNLIAEARALVEASHAEYAAGCDQAGQIKLERLESLLKCL